MCKVHVWLLHMVLWLSHGMEFNEDRKAQEKQRQTHDCGFEASLVYRGNFKTVRATQRDLVSPTEREGEKKKEEKEVEGGKKKEEGRETEIDRDRESASLPFLI